MKVTIPGTTLQMPPIGLGLVDYGMAERGAVVDQVLNRYQELGGQLVDTAHCYGFWKPDGTGCSESCLGDYIKRNGKGNLIISTKGGHPGAPNYRIADDFLSPRRISADIDDSLARLRVDSIEIYFLHRDDPRLPTEEIIDYLNEEVRRGRIQSLGASNWKCYRIEEANNYAKKQGFHGFSVSQPLWSLADHAGNRAADTVTVGKGEIDWHARTGIALMPYNAAARGFFATDGQKGGKSYDLPENRAKLERCKSMASELAKTPNQLALAWLINHSFPVLPLVGTKNLDHLDDAMRALSIKLSSTQLDWLKNG